MESKTHIVSFVYGESFAIPIHFKSLEQVDAAFESIEQAQRADKKVAIFDAAHGKASVRLGYLAAFTRTETH